MKSTRNKAQSFGQEKQKDFSDQKRIDSQPENSLSGDGSRLVSNEALASKLKVNFFVLLRVALIVLQA